MLVFSGKYFGIICIVFWSLSVSCKQYFPYRVSQAFATLFEFSGGSIGWALGKSIIGLNVLEFGSRSKYLQNGISVVFAVGGDME